MNRAQFYSAIRKSLFNGSLNSSQVKGIDGILDAFEKVGDGQADTLAYALATAFHETGRRMVPVREGFATTDAGARLAVRRLAEKRGPNSAVAKYAKPTGPYDHVYYGRGHVQLTWLENYRDSSADAGVDLVANPDAMLDPEISARVLIAGILDGRWNGRRHGLRYYADADGVPGLDFDDAVEARRTVNVKDKAAMIAGYYTRFLEAIQEASK